MKILYITEYFPPYTKGGAEISTSLVVRYISKFHQCFVFTQKHQKETYVFAGAKVYPILEETSSGLGNFTEIIRYLILDFWIYPLINFIKAYFFIKKEKIDILHVVATSDLMIPIIYAAIFTHKPVVVDVRGGTLLCPSAFGRPGCFEKSVKKHDCLSSLSRSTGIWPKRLEIFRFLFAHYRFITFKIFYLLLKIAIGYKKLIIVALSKYVMEQHLLAGIPKEKLKVIYNMMDVSATKNKNLKNKRIVFAGRIEKEKGIWDAIKAVEILNDDSIEFDIAGSGQEFKNISLYVTKKGLNYIKLLGKIPNDTLIKLYAKSKIILAPSIWPEPFGRFIQDSISSGTPCIATKVGGIPEGITDRETGMLVEPSNPKQLANVIKELLTNQELYNRIVQNLAQEEYKYSAEVIGKQRMELYDSLLNH